MTRKLSSVPSTPSSPRPAEDVARGICKLCRQERELRDSHIVTEYIYKPLYDDRRKMLGFRHDQRGLKPKQLQKGLREPLLCDDCEGHFNTHFEHPSQKAWGDSRRHRKRRGVVRKTDHHTWWQ